MTSAAAVAEVLPAAVLRLKYRKATGSEQRFKRAYWSRPEAFVHECLEWPDGKGPTDYQDEILAGLVEHRREAVRGPHGLGKTALASWVILWFSLTRDGEDWKAVTTAGTWRQLVRYLWPEVRKWARLLKWSKIGRSPFDSRLELQRLALRLTTGEAFAVASDDPTLIEGAHADHLLYILDESKAIGPGTWDAVEGAFSGAGADTVAEAYELSISTPGEPQGRFYEIHARKVGYEDWHVRHVRFEETIRAGRMSREWAAQRALQWGEESAVYQNRVRGEFASSEADTVIALAWVEAAIERWREWQDARVELPPFSAVGADPARSGEDQTAIAPRFGNIITEIRRTRLEDTMATAGRIKGILDVYPGGRAVVDVIGIGAGVVDRLREGAHAERICAFNASEHTEFKDRSGELGFVNKRSAAWWNLREMLEPNSGDDVMLPDDDQLIGDLTAPHWRVTSGGKIQIESKDDLRKPDRLGRSTDTGDAVVQAFAPEVLVEGTPGLLGFYRGMVEQQRKEGQGGD